MSRYITIQQYNPCRTRCKIFDNLSVLVTCANRQDANQTLTRFYTSSVCTRLRINVGIEFGSYENRCLFRVKLIGLFAQLDVDDFYFFSRYARTRFFRIQNNIFIVISSDAYVFGYELGPDGQFHHENRGPDGVTYGCYGNIENDVSVRVTHYIADASGYRTITPADEVQINRQFGSDGKALNEIDPGTHHSNLRFGKFTPWGQLYFPKGCSSVRTRNGTIIYFPGVPRPKDDIEPTLSGQPTISNSILQPGKI